MSDPPTGASEREEAVRARRAQAAQRGDESRAAQWARVAEALDESLRAMRQAQAACDEVSEEVRARSHAEILAQMKELERRTVERLQGKRRKTDALRREARDNGLRLAGVPALGRPPAPLPWVAVLGAALLLALLVAVTLLAVWVR